MLHIIFQRHHIPFDEVLSKPKWAQVLMLESMQIQLKEEEKQNVIIQDERRQADIEYVAKKYGIDTNNPAMREAAEVTAVRSREAMEMGRTQRRYY